VTLTDGTTCVVRHKLGKNGPSYLLREHGDLSFLLYFSKQCLVGNTQRKFQKNFRQVTFLRNYLNKVPVYFWINFKLKRGLVEGALMKQDILVV